VRSARASKIVDVMTGLSLVMNGLSEMGNANPSRALAVVALAGGGLILAALILRRRLEGRFQHFHTLVVFIEGLMCAVVGMVSMQRGTNSIQFAWMLAAVAFFSAGVIKVRRAQNPIGGRAAVTQGHEGR
jgi:hypothetical protein